MTEKDALDWGNAMLARLDVSSLMRFRAGTHSGGQICVELVSTEGYPDYYLEPELIDFEFAKDFKTAVGRILLRVRLSYKD